MYYAFGRSKASETVQSYLITQIVPVTIALLCLTAFYVIFIAPFRLHLKDVEELKKTSTQRDNILAERDRLLRAQEDAQRIQKECKSLLVEKEKLLAELDELKTPSVLLDFLEVRDGLDEGVYTAVLIVTGKGQGIPPLRLWCVDIRPEGSGSTTLSYITDQPGVSIALQAGETTRVDAIRYDWKESGADINVLIPSKLSDNMLIRGKAFIILFAVYGLARPVELAVRCWMGDGSDDRLHAEKFMTQSIAGTQDSWMPAT